MEVPASQKLWSRLDKVIEKCEKEESVSHKPSGAYRTAAGSGLSLVSAA